MYVICTCTNLKLIDLGKAGKYDCSLFCIFYTGVHSMMYDLLPKGTYFRFNPFLRGKFLSLDRQGVLSSYCRLSVDLDISW